MDLDNDDNEVFDSVDVDVDVDQEQVEHNNRRRRSSSIASSSSTSKKPKRRRSVDVASVYRGSFHHESDDDESDQDIEGLPMATTTGAIDSSFVTSASSTNTNDDDVERSGGPSKRRNSLQVATLYREKSRKSLTKELAAASGQRQQPRQSPFWWETMNMNSLQVSSRVIRNHIEYGDGGGGNDNADDEDQQQDDHHYQHHHRVQLNIPAGGGDHPRGNLLVRRQNRTAVTFGAYMDTHNDEMIPELVRVSTTSSGNNDDTSSSSEEVDDPESPSGTTSTTTTTSKKKKKKKKKSSSLPLLMHQAMKRLQTQVSNGSPITQMIATFVSVILTHVIMNYAYPQVDLQLMTMVLVVLCGATLPHLITSVACGVYAGSVSNNTLPFPAVLLLAFITSIAWQFISYQKIMLGYSGRLGATAFFSMNVSAILTYVMVDTSKFSQYYYSGGNINSYYTTDRSSLDIIMECLITILSTTFLAMSASWFRLHSSIPVNPVLIPSAWALGCMLLVGCGLSLLSNGDDDDGVNTVHHRYNIMIQNGFAVGSYVAMAAESRLPSVYNFGVVGGIASMYILLFNPLFRGFGGKSGFTAMIAYLTYLTIQKTILAKIKSKMKKTKNDDSEQQVLPK